jgi:hypothetical protein
MNINYITMSSIKLIYHNIMACMQGIRMPYASTIHLLGNNNYKIEVVNHFTICKIPIKNHPSYSKLVDFLEVCIEVK